MPLAAVVLALGLVVAAAACSSGGPKDVGQPAPGFSLENVRDGQPPVELAALRGKPVVLNVWASWCEPCKQEMPAFQQVHERVGDQVQFVGVDSQDSRRKAVEFMTQTGVTYPSGYDPADRVFTRYKLFGRPTTMLIDARGRLLAKHTGQLSVDELEDLIRKHFDEVRL